MTGAISPNLHEGSRSKYLAQFVFSAWGTAVPVPHQEDYGLDLFCSLVERDGQRAWAHSPYTVQVKSEMKEWIFEGEQAVRWLVQHPSPLFLCVVDKSTARVRIYQTSQRFYIWGRGQLPSRIGLMPTIETDGVRPKWPDDGKEFSLGAPILDFSIEDFLQQDVVDKAKRTLKSWIEVDEQNLSRRRNGIRRFVVPKKSRSGQSSLVCALRSLITSADSQPFTLRKLALAENSLSRSRVEMRATTVDTSPQQNLASGEQSNFTAQPTVSPSSRRCRRTPGRVPV